MKPENVARRGSIVTLTVLVSVALVATSVAAATFTDTGGNVHEADIDAVAAAGITKGCNPPANDRYCPDQDVTRGQMAAFLVRGLNLGASDDRPFEDTDGSVFQADIAALAAAGITKGCNPPQNDRYCPGDDVSREEMAAFLVRGLNLGASDDRPFEDTDGSVFQADIAALAAAGITKGCNPPQNDRYCPQAPVTRAQMASFLVRALDLAPVGPSCERWISAGGDDGADGSRSDPWRTVEHAVEAVPQAGCVITALPGVYEAAEIERRFDAMTTIRSSQPYRAVLRGSSMVLSIDGARNVTIEGFEITQSGPSAQNVMINIEDGDGRESEHIAVRNNIIHDSYENDLLKIRSGARFVTVEGNVFYNQGANEQHMDINGVRDVVVQDNVFFNDFEASGRDDPGDTKAFIVVKDSSGTGPELGSHRITLRRNVFMNWKGGPGEPMLQIGNDGKPYHEAVDVRIEGNLLLANSPDQSEAPLAVVGARDVVFAHNTVSGGGPWDGFVMRLEEGKGQNPDNEDVLLANNIYSSPSGDVDDFATGNDGSATLHNNLYWVGSGSLPTDGELAPGDDQDRVSGNPGLPGTGGITLPVWDGSGFPGESSIRQEFIRIVEDHASLPASSPAVDAADPAQTPALDILGRSRGADPDLGALER